MKRAIAYTCTENLFYAKTDPAQSRTAEGVVPNEC